MSLLDILTGGKTSEAEDELKSAQEDIQAVQTPSEQALLLPELQQYVNSGLMTPAQAEAAVQGNSEMSGVNTDPRTTEAEMTALSQLQDVAGNEGMTDTMKAQLQAALNTANTNTAGERGSIIDKMAQRGIPTSLMGSAAQMATAGQDAQTANLSSTQAAGQAEQNALTAMANSGTLAGNINNQQFSQGAQKAQAQDTINQWNAANKTNVNLSNANMKQNANILNTENAQNVSNSNTGLANTRTQYNAQVPETVFQNQIQKAGAEAGVSEQQANNATAQGQQQAGLIGGLIGGASQVAAAAATPTASDGGNVPGKAKVPGDSKRNDQVHAMLSPGEVVVPRSIAHDPDRVKQFVTHLMRQPKPIKPMHPDDLHGIMEAMSRRREQAA